MENFNEQNMEIREEFIKIKDFVEGYENHDNEAIGGVFTMNRKVIVRPYYQRSYIRKNHTGWKRNLIYSILKGYPISLFYFGVNDDGTYDMIDGQQRSITICDFVNHGFDIEIDGKPYCYTNLPNIYKDKFDNYKLRVNMCIGDEDSKLRWFEIINQPIAQLEKQELRNATYHGTWLEENKKYFSAPTAMTRGKEVLDKESKYAAFRYTEKPKIERQEILQLALDWASASEFPELLDKSTNNKEKMHRRIEKYMSKHQNDVENTLIEFYKKVIDWIWETFIDFDVNPYSSRGVEGTPHSMAAVDWGRIYYEYHNQKFDTKYISQRVCELMGDTDIISTKNIYEYVLGGEKDKSLIQIRAFSQNDKNRMYFYQGGIDPLDGKHYSFKDMESHHIKAWVNGGKTKLDNLVMLAKRNHIDFHNHEFDEINILKKRDELWAKNNPIEYAKYLAHKQVDEKFEKITA